MVNNANMNNILRQMRTLEQPLSNIHMIHLEAVMYTSGLNTLVCSLAFYLVYKNLQELF